MERKETFGPETLTRRDGTVLVFIPTAEPFAFAVVMVGNPCYNIGIELMNKETTK